MVAKKTIFEKLGLIEPIEGEGQETPVTEATKEETKETLDQKDAIPAETKPGEPKADQDTKKEEDPLPFGVDLLAAKKEDIKPKSQAAGESIKKASEEPVVKAETIKQNQSAEIEEKLDVLIGSYEKNKMMTIDDIYRTSRMEADKKKTIFMVDVFQKTLPENLPIDVKRASVMNIMDVSSINLENLLSDAYKRIDALNNVLEETVQTTDDVVKKNEASIEELENRIKELKKVTEARQQFQEDQTSVIEYEIQKIIGIVDFIKPKK
ncbi:hypothetical protein [Fusibacter sp. JL216-2]|uniref:hypothetical protein n=1 Tax=Fusibacter sp. JL216-2 TaxID=3071453 RepID=UPI003D330087